MIRVVSIDDNHEVRESFKEYFRNCPGIELVGTAENGEAGYELIKSKNPDVVILDIVMPKLDGLGLLEKLSVNGEMPRVIMYSAIGNDTVIQKAISSGAEYYIMKPCDLSDIVSYIRQSCNASPSSSSVISAHMRNTINENNLESIITDISNTIRYCNTFQQITIIKSAPSNTCYTIST